MILRPFTYVPFVLFKSTMMRRPSLRTIRACRFDTLPLGRMISLPCTRPMWTSGLSKSIFRGAPPFSVMETENIVPRG